MNQKQIGTLGLEFNEAQELTEQQLSEIAMRDNQRQKAFWQKAKKARVQH